MGKIKVNWLSVVCMLATVLCVVHAATYFISKDLWVYAVFSGGVSFFWPTSGRLACFYCEYKE